MTDIDDEQFLLTTNAVRKVAGAVADGHIELAAERADAALEQGLIHPVLLNARALRFEQQGKDAEALTEYQRARALSPNDALLLNAIGLCMTRLHRLDEAIEAFDGAIRVLPAYGPSYHRKGLALGMCGRPKEAERAHLRATQLQPGNADALASLASLAAHRGDWAAAARLAHRALRAEPRNASAHAAMALVEISNGDCAEAEARLRPLLNSPSVAAGGRAVLLGLLADAIDAQGRHSEAFEFYGSANKELRSLHALRFGRPVAGVVDDLAEFLSSVPETHREAAAPSLESANTEPNQHVFLLGFHRSGTTLLEQVLESHPDIVTLEERDILAPLAERFLTSEAGMQSLEGASDTVLALARADYWQGVQGHGVSVRGKTFVDKHPLNTIKLPLIARLFPEAKILFALRDPRDVVLSCFRRHFEINAVMYEYLTLEGAAALYDSVMKLADISRAKLPLEFLDVRYEDLVADFERQVRAVCDFIGVPWSETTRNFSEAARHLDARSPSAPQIRRGLYNEAIGKWRQYAAELEPVFPTLRPWIDRFGYPPD